MILHTLTALGEQRREAMLDEARHARLIRAIHAQRPKRPGAAKRGFAWASLTLGYALIHLGARLDPPQE